MDQAGKWWKWQALSQCTLAVLLMAAIFFIVVFYMQNTSDLDGYLYDVSTVTVQDYTVEMDITNVMWEEFESNFYERHKNEEEKTKRMSKALYLKKYLISKIGEILTHYNENHYIHEKDHEGLGNYELTDAEKEKLQVRVFDVSFAFNNHNLIEILKKRGTAITSLDFDQVRESDEKINEMIKDDKQYENLTKPVCAFITFYTDEGKNAAISYSERETMFQKRAKVNFEKMTLLNTTPEFVDST